jgi:hypothetical protein
MAGWTLYLINNGVLFNIKLYRAEWGWNMILDVEYVPIWKKAVTLRGWRKQREILLVRQPMEVRTEYFSSTSPDS